MVVLEESIEVANVLVKLQVSEKAIVELKKRTGREGTRVLVLSQRKKVG